MKKIVKKTAELDREVRYDEVPDGFGIMLGMVMFDKAVLNEVFGHIPERIVVQFSLEE